MGFLDFFKSPDIHQGVKEWSSVPGAILLDVRTPEEFRQGYIPGSVNIPLQSLEDIQGVAESEDTPLYVYCYSGSRSRQAAALLDRMGYSNVKNIGGIAAWSGKVEE